MDVDMVTKEADKVVEKVAKVGDLIILVSLDWCNLVLLEFTICTLQSFQSYLGKVTKKRGNFSVNLAKSWINLVLQYEMIIDTCAPAIPQLTAF